MSKRYDSLNKTAELAAAINALCEHDLHVTSSTDARVTLTCRKCGAKASREVVPHVGPLEWAEGTPVVTLVRVRISPCLDSWYKPGLLYDKNHVGVFYKERGCRDHVSGALRGLSYASIHQATDEEPDVRDLRKNLTAWLDAVNTVDLQSGADHVLATLCAIPRWERLIYKLDKADSFREAVDLSNVDGPRGLSFHLSGLAHAEYEDDYGSVKHPVLTWLGKEPTDAPGEESWQTMPTPSRQVIEMSLAAVADTLRRVAYLKSARMSAEDYTDHVNVVQQMVDDIVNCIREEMEADDEVADVQDTLDKYAVEHRCSRDATCYIVFDTDVYPNPKKEADLYKAWMDGEVSNFAVETIEVYQPSDFEDIKDNYSCGDWEIVEEDEFYGTWIGDDLREYIEPKAEKYAEEIGGHLLGVVDVD